jgi:hypothetical protein
MTFATTKPPRCKHCKARTDRPGRVLHDDCVGPWYEANREKLARKAERKKELAARAEKAKDRQTLEAMKTMPKLHKEARFWFNRWIRLRDAEKPCISCGAPPPDLSGLHAGRDCGHFRSVGSAGHLRYSEDNAAAQCVHCNQHLSGNYLGFRNGQIERIGLARVEALENDNRPEKWQRDQVRGIRDTYRARVRELKKVK